MCRLQPINNGFPECWQCYNGLVMSAPCESWAVSDGSIAFANSNLVHCFHLHMRKLMSSEVEWHLSGHRIRSRISTGGDQVFWTLAQCFCGFYCCCFRETVVGKKQMQLWVCGPFTHGFNCPCASFCGLGIMSLKHSMWAARTWGRSCPFKPWAHPSLRQPVPTWSCQIEPTQNTGWQGWVLGYFRSRDISNKFPWLLNSYILEACYPSWMKTSASLNVEFMISSSKWHHWEESGLCRSRGIILKDQKKKL